MSKTIGHHKLAEQIFILNDRLLGILTRLHHMKQLLASNDYRPSVLPGGDKEYDSAWKTLFKKFPSPEFKSHLSSLQPFLAHEKEIFALLSGHYYNYVDVLEVRDHVNDTLSRFACAHFTLDFTINSDLTRLYLELSSNYFAMMFFLTRLPDTKAILALFNFLHDHLNGKSESHFPRMAELFTDSPVGMLRQLANDMAPHSRILSKALGSLGDLSIRRTVRAQNWSDAHFLDVLHEPSQIQNMVLGDQLACELIPYEVMERWVMFGYLLIYKELSDDDAFTRLKTALRHTCVVVLFRDEVIYIHALYQSFLESVWSNKVGGKKVNEVKEALGVACSQAIEVHAGRRDYLRSTLRQLYYLLSDEPGLFGPKAFLVFWGLSYATDEVHWLLRHLANPPMKKGAVSTVRAGSTPLTDYGDPHIGELLFYMEELRMLVDRYAPVIQRFYGQLLACYDSPGLSNYSQDIIPLISSEEATILASMIKTLSDLSTHDQTSSARMSDQLSRFDFSGIRLDWLRLQASLCSNDSLVDLPKYRRLFDHLHSTAFHTKLVDFLDELLRSVSDMSIFTFYQPLFVDLFNNLLRYPAQLRFATVFPNLCAHSIQACHELCPEERPFLGRSSVSLAHYFCQKIADRIVDDLLTRLDEFGYLYDQLSAVNAVPICKSEKSKKSKAAAARTKQQVDGGDRKPSVPTKAKGKACADDQTLRFIPGSESVRHNRIEQTQNDRTLFSLSELCQAVNHYREIIIYDRIVYPREELQNELQARLIEVLSKYAEPTIMKEMADEPIITKPSELLRRVRALMDVLVDLEHHVCIDVASLLSTIFSQHTQPRDALSGKPTMTYHYTKWYLEVFLKHAYENHFIFSPCIKSFVTVASSGQVKFRAEEFADLNELHSLAELIGPLGMKHMCDQIMQTVGDRLDNKIKKMVIQNRTTLESLRGCFDDPLQTKQLADSLTNRDDLLNELKDIGLALAFRRMCMEALHDVLGHHTPFLLATVHNLRNHVTQQSGGKLLPPSLTSNPGKTEYDTRDEMEAIYSRFNSQLLLNSLSSSMGILSDLDSTLCSILNSRRQAAIAAAMANNTGPPSDLDYRIACLFIVFVANALPCLARQEQSLFLVDLEANANNAHCIVYAVNTLMVAMFSLLCPGDLEARSKEFLALASSNLLRLGLESQTSILSAELNIIPTSNSQSSASTSSHHNPAKHRDSIYLLFDNLIRFSPCLSHSLQEACFPYSLIRCAYHNVAKVFANTDAVTGRTDFKQRDW